MSALAVPGSRLDCRLEEVDLTGLFRRIAEKDEEAMTELYARTKTTLAQYVNRLLHDRWDTEDVLQEVYRQLWLNASTYRSDRGTPPAWLYMVARSRALDHLRRNRRQESLFLSEGEATAAAPNAAGAEASVHCCPELIHRSLSRLSQSERQFIVLAYFEGYSHSEIAAKTGVPLGTVKSRIRRALTRLRELLGSDDGRNVPPPAAAAGKVLRFAA